MCRKQNENSSNKELLNITSDEYDLQSIKLEGEYELFFRPSMFDENVKQNSEKGKCLCDDNDLYNEKGKKGNPV